MTDSYSINISSMTTKKQGASPATSERAPYAQSIYSIRKRSNEHHRTTNPQRSSMQYRNAETLHSGEGHRPATVSDTASPSHGIVGALTRFALFANRMGIIGGKAKGLKNIKWTDSRKRTVGKVAVAAGATAALAGLIIWRYKRGRKQEARS